LTNQDAIDFLATMAIDLRERSLTYLDPPYFVKGRRRLYANYYAAPDHEQVAQLLGSYPRCWLVSYDYAPEILTLYRRYQCRVYRLRYTAAQRRSGREVMFVSEDLHLP
jgi:DNA adenine methylase